MLHINTIFTSFLSDLDILIVECLVNKGGESLVKPFEPWNRLYGKTGVDHTYPRDVQLVCLQGSSSNVCDGGMTPSTPTNCDCRCHLSLQQTIPLLSSLVVIMIITMMMITR